MPEWIWPGDSTARVPADDRGLAYGQGVFETLRVGPQGAVLLEAHRDRLLAGCRALGIAFGDEDFRHWLQQAQALGLAQPQHPAVLKLTVTAGSGGRGYRPPETVEPRVITALMPWSPAVGDGVWVMECRQTLSADGPARGFKTLARLEQVLASAELGADHFEGLMAVTGLAGWVEGTRSCLFSLQGQTLVTPPREQLAVAGTLRDWLIENASRLGVGVERRFLNQTDGVAHGLMVGNSVMGLVPVSGIGANRIPITEAAWQLAERVNRELGLG